MANPRHVDLEEVEKLATEMVSEDNIARLVGYNSSHWFEVKKKRPEIADAIKRGRAKSEQNLARRLFAIVNDKGDPKSLAAITFALKCRHKWREIQEIEINGNIKHTAEALPPQERSMRLALLQAQLNDNDYVDAELVDA